MAHMQSGQMLQALWLIKQGSCHYSIARIMKIGFQYIYPNEIITTYFSRDTHVESDTWLGI